MICSEWGKPREPTRRQGKMTICWVSLNPECPTGVYTSYYSIFKYLNFVYLFAVYVYIYIYSKKNRVHNIYSTVSVLRLGCVRPQSSSKKMNSCWHCPVYNGVHLILVKRHCTRFSHILPSLWFYCAVRRAILLKSWPNSKRSTLFFQISKWIVMARYIFCRSNLATFKHQMVDFLI